MLYCGMCHSDCHKIDDDWKDHVAYPMVPGHEVVGTVAEVGVSVSGFAVGDMVGFGPQRGSCGGCDSCAAGRENCCGAFEGLYDPKFGGYATSITVNAAFAFKIPAALCTPAALPRVGPLLCAGITTFAPLARHAKAGQRVGVVGIGGLGHMGLQYAAAMGCETWAISTSAAKEAEARTFGAKHFLVSKDAAAVAAAKGTFDFILCCASGDFDTDLYMSLLKARAAFCLVGLPAVDSPVKFKPFSIVGGEKAIYGSMIGGAPAMRDMLEFSAKHACLPKVEVIDFADANKGFDTIKANAARCECAAPQERATPAPLPRAAHRSLLHLLLASPQTASSSRSARKEAIDRKGLAAASLFEPNNEKNSAMQEKKGENERGRANPPPALARTCPSAAGSSAVQRRNEGYDVASAQRPRRAAFELPVCVIGEDEDARPHATSIARPRKEAHALARKQQTRRAREPAHELAECPHVARQRQSQPLGASKEDLQTTTKLDNDVQARRSRGCRHL